MNWSQRHLNWTWVLGYPLTLVIMLFITEFVMGGADSTASDIVVVVALVIMLGVSAWVIYQKGRSLWWLLFLGQFSPLWLSNKKKKLEPLNS